MIPFSVLDLSPVGEGSTVGEALRNTLALAQHAERLGFHRYWLAEHHNFPGIASAATSVVIGYVAAGTSRIRVGSGGIMLPNHAPLVIAEQFGTLAELFPDRIDLGLGRAPGTDQSTMRALRRHGPESEDEFPREVRELQRYLDDPEPGQRIRAVPGSGTHVPIYMLGSSLFGAQLAAMLGIPFAFASHFAPGFLMQALQVYRERYTPSDRWPRPYAMVACNMVLAETDAAAEFLFSSQRLGFVRLRRGAAGLLPAPREGVLESLSPSERAMLESALACSFVGTVDSVRGRVASFLEQTGADELIVSAQIHDAAKRRESYERVAQLRDELQQGGRAPGKPGLPTDLATQA